MIPVWLLAVLAVIHALASVAFLLKGNYGLSLVMIGGMLVQFGLMIAARG